MEQYIKGLDVNTGNQQSAKSVALLLDVSNGQTKIINTYSSEVSGGNSVQSAISNMTKRSSEDMKHGTRDRKVYRNGITFLGYVRPLGTKALKARMNYLADIAEQNSIRRKLHPVSARSRVQCIKDLIYLLENNLIT